MAIFINSSVITGEVILSISQLPVANFEADVVTGTAPLEVQFTDTSTGSPTSWAWDFQNNGSVDSTLQNPTFTYPLPGTYTVKLTVTNAQGSAEIVKTAYIVVDPVAPDDQSFTTPGTYNFVVPAGVGEISLVTVGGGGGAYYGSGSSNYYFAAAGGGGLRYVNSLPVTPGETLTVVVGAGGASVDPALGGPENPGRNPTAGGDSYIQRGSDILILAGGGQRPSGTSGSLNGFTGGAGGTGTTFGAGPFGGTVGGGNGGAGGSVRANSAVRLTGCGGGGAGGYSGTGGAGGGRHIVTDAFIFATAGAGGGGGGGQVRAGSGPSNPAGGAGGVGILGQGVDGQPGSGDTANGLGGLGGSSGSAGQDGVKTNTAITGDGGGYGGGAGSNSQEFDPNAFFYLTQAKGGGGAVRIIWGGVGRSYPSNAA
jgi:PKD repeat protein